MTVLTIPGVSERTVARLRARAIRNEHSLEDEVRDILDAATAGGNTMYLFSLHEALSEALEAEDVTESLTLRRRPQHDAGAA